MLTRNPGHLKTFDYIGLHRYFLTFCTHAREKHFVFTERVDVVWQQFVRAAADEGMSIIAYCFMPDHVHLLVEGVTESSDCLAFIKRAKQFSGFYYKQKFGRRLWQRYGFEHVLRDDEATLSVARYIVENPLRAGLALRVRDYPFLGSGAHSLHEILDGVQMMNTPWR